MTVIVHDVHVKRPVIMIILFLLFALLSDGEGGKGMRRKMGSLVASPFKVKVGSPRTKSRPRTNRPATSHGQFALTFAIANR